MTYAGDADISIDPRTVSLYKAAKRGSTIFHCKDNIDDHSGVSTSCIAYFKARYVDEKNDNRVDYFPAQVVRFCKCKLQEKDDGPLTGTEVLLCCVVWLYSEDGSELGGVIDMPWAKRPQPNRLDTIPACLLAAPGHYTRAHEPAQMSQFDDLQDHGGQAATVDRILIQMGNWY